MPLADQLLKEIVNKCKSEKNPVKWLIRLLEVRDRIEVNICQATILVAPGLSREVCYSPREEQARLRSDLLRELDECIKNYAERLVNICWKLTGSYTRRACLDFMYDLVLSLKPGLTKALGERGVYQLLERVQRVEKKR